MWLTLGFAGMGILIGSLVGMTSEKVVTPVIGLLFSFVGASILTTLHKLNPHDRLVAGKAIFALSLFCLVGVYSGVLVTEYRLLSPKIQGVSASSAKPEKTSDSSAPDNKYLRSATIDKANAIDLLKAQGRLSPDEAYAQMYQLARESTSPDKK